MMHKKFAVFDIDGTVFRYALYLELVKELINMGAFNQDDASKILGSLEAWKVQRDNKSFWTHVDLTLSTHEQNLPNVSVDTYEKAVEATFRKNKDFVYSYPMQLINKLRSQGYLIFAISGSQVETVEKFCKYHGFDDYVGSTHTRDVTGTIFTTETIHSHKDKSKLVTSLANKHGASFVDSIGVGDTHGDIGMLELVDIPIAFNPNSTLYAHAKKRKWDIVVERKDVIYHLTRSNSKYQLEDALSLITLKV